MGEIRRTGVARLPTQANNGDEKQKGHDSVHTAGTDADRSRRRMPIEAEWSSEQLRPQNRSGNWLRKGPDGTRSEAAPGNPSANCSEPTLVRLVAAGSVPQDTA